MSPCFPRAAGRLARGAAGRDWPAAVVLATALATIFLFSDYDRGQFQPPSASVSACSGHHQIHHAIVSLNHLAVAANLSPEHGYLQFYRRYIDRTGGEPVYEPYHRFPLLGYALIKLAGLPFGDDLPGRLRAARVLMLVFFCGAALLAYSSLRRLAARRAAALAATLLAFSSYPLLYHGDMVATEGVVDLFAVMLAFHGVAVYSQRRAGRRGDGRPDGAGGGGLVQLHAKTCAALLLGWHVYGLLLPLLLVALPRAAWARDWREFRRFLLLGAAAAFAGIATLAFNFAREHAGLGGSTPFLELPSVESMLRRTGVAPVDEFIGWGAFIEQQFCRLGEAALPWALAEPLHQGRLHGRWHWVGGACMALAAAAIAWPGTRHRIAWSGIALCGLGWALPMRYSAQAHGFEAMFHVGGPLAAGALVLTRLQAFAAARRPRRSPVGAAPEAAAVAAAVTAAFVLFVASSWTMGRVGADARTWERQQALMADVQEIRRHIRGKVVYVPWTVRWVPGYRIVSVVDLTGSVWTLEPTVEADFVLATDPRSAVFQPGDGLLNWPASRSLTPGNRVLLLHDADVYHAALSAARAAYERLANEERPAIESGFDVHHVGDALLYVGEGKSCTVDAPRLRAGSRTSRPVFDGRGFGIPDWKLFLHVHPVDVNDLQPGRRRLGFARLDFVRDPTWWTRDGRCYAVRFLPTFPIARIRTGRFHYAPDYGIHNVWEGSFSPRGDGGEDGVAGEYQRIAAREPAARSAWDVHVLGGAGELAFLKTPCASGDVADRFFVHVVPVDASALPADRRRLRHDNLDFDFLDRGGARADGKCVVRARLPDYDIATVRTGQYRGAVELWSVELPPTRFAAGSRL